MRKNFSLLELIVVVFAIGLVATIVFALLPNERARRAACQENMRAIHVAMTMYLQDYTMFPSQQGGPSSYSSGDAQQTLNLLYSKYTSDLRIFSCPSKPLSPTVLANIQASNSPEWPGSSGTTFQEAAAGSSGYSTSYGYSPGHNLSNLRVVILADHQGVWPKGNSDNHGKDVGQNVLTVGGAVTFQTDKKHNLGPDKSGQEIIDNDIFTYNTIQPRTYVDWDSICR